jgi:hypothetical protein
VLAVIVLAVYSQVISHQFLSYYDNVYVVNNPHVARHRPALYFLSLLSFILGLMSKPMLVTLPIIMLLMDYWPLNRYSHEGQGLKQFSARATTLIKDKSIFLFCSIISAVITIYVQGTSGAIKSFEIIPFGIRVENALIAYAK